MTAIAQARPVKTVFKAGSSAYSYTLTQACGIKHAVLRLRVSRKMMDAFRSTDLGRTVGHMVDIFEQGNGWYEITDNETYLAKMLKKFGTVTNGLMTWLRNFNIANLPAVTKHEIVAAAPAAFHSPSPQHDLIKPTQVKTQAPKPVADPGLVNSLSKLAARFGKTLQVVA